MLNFLKEKEKKDLPTYLPKQKLIGRSMVNKYIFKDGLTYTGKIWYIYASACLASEYAMINYNAMSSCCC